MTRWQLRQIQDERRRLHRALAVCSPERALVLTDRIAYLDAQIAKDRVEHVPLEWRS